MSIYDPKLHSLEGEPASVGDYRGKALLVVNVASKCGLTPQYEGLERLQKSYGDRGFTVLGFPCNQFLHQEPGTAEEIQRFCTVNYGVTFPMFSKIEVNGEGAHLLYRYLKSERSGLLGSEAIKWNFTKFLVDRNGKVVDRFAPSTKPSGLSTAIEGLL